MDVGRCMDRDFGPCRGAGLLRIMKVVHALAGRNSSPCGRVGESDKGGIFWLGDTSSRRRLLMIDTTEGMEMNHTKRFKAGLDLDGLVEGRRFS